ncbi:MAG TPA: hypothetical protein VM686_42560, partial [Polyangiaceae bacterium]|nr:hypothetical protein [Polyangiaceae bacterium]
GLLAPGLAALVGCSDPAPPPAPSTAGTGGVAGSSGSGGSAGSSAGSAGSAGVGGDTGGTGGVGGGGSGGSGGLVLTEPMLLSEAGLYSDIATGTLAPDVIEFTPQFALWSDGAAKKRWIKLPAGAQINTADMNFWDYPAGTKFFKEFERDGVRVETRLIMKKSPGVWFMMPYKWRDDMMDADALPAGEANARGTTHDIPSQEDCGTCHNAMRDRVLGFTAVELAHNNGGFNLAQATAMGMLTAPPVAEPVVPGDEVAKAAIGYLHVNCGMCHNYKSKIYSNGTQVDMWLQTDKLTTLEETPTYLTLVNQDTTTELTLLPKRIAPGDTANSAVFELMNRRGDDASMPPLGTEITDTAGGIAAIEAWINALPPP